MPLQQASYPCDQAVGPGKPVLAWEVVKSILCDEISACQKSCDLSLLLNGTCFFGTPEPKDMLYRLTKGCSEKDKIAAIPSGAQGQGRGRMVHRDGRPSLHLPDDSSATVPYVKRGFVANS
jgi:hypothetical protein